MEWDCRLTATGAHANRGMICSINVRRTNYIARITRPVPNRHGFVIRLAPTGISNPLPLPLDRCSAGTTRRSIFVRKSRAALRRLPDSHPLRRLQRLMRNRQITSISVTAWTTVGRADICGSEQGELTRHTAMPAIKTVMPKTSEDTIIAVSTGFLRNLYKVACK
jgi:hypothetical protein